MLHLISSLFHSKQSKYILEFISRFNPNKQSEQQFKCFGSFLSHKTLINQKIYQNSSPDSNNPNKHSNSRKSLQKPNQRWHQKQERNHTETELSFTDKIQIAQEKSRKKKKMKSKKIIQLNSFEELIVLRLSPALSTLGNGVRFPSSLL